LGTIHNGDCRKKCQKWKNKNDQNDQFLMGIAAGYKMSFKGIAAISVIYAISANLYFFWG